MFPFPPPHMNSCRTFLAARRFLCAAVAVCLPLFGQTLRAQAPPATLDQIDFMKASELAEQGKFEEARALFAGIPEKYPTSPVIPQAVLKLGYVYFRMNDYGKAVEFLQKVPTLKNA